MYRKAEIEKKILALDGTTFQLLCADYIRYDYNEEILSFENTGAQLGKKSTIRGVPDAYIYTANNQYVFVEATTQQTGLLMKFTNDIDGCIKKCNDKSISLTNVTEIILAFNSRIGVEQESQIINKYYSYPFKLKFINIDILTDALLDKYAFLASDYLEVVSPRKQISPLLRFVEQYNTKRNKFATPINNPFYARKEELSSIRLSISKSDLILISGDAGVGKTKIAVEAIEEFVREHPEYHPYAIGRNEYANIIEDLDRRTYSEKNLIILIDDVNNKLEILREILNTIYLKPHLNLKLVLTVRQYAYLTVVDSLKNLLFDYEEVFIHKFSFQDFSLLISSEPYNITDNESIYKLYKVANGNARLAMMAIMVLNNNFDIVVLETAIAIYDSYFNSIITDLSRNISTKDLVTTLGLVSAFNTIKLENEENCLIQQISTSFDIPTDKLTENIELLEEYELLEIHEDFKRAKISEQVVYTYFFYKLFIVDKFLSLDILLEDFFESNSYHISSILNSISDTFGKDEYIKASLKRFYSLITHKYKGSQDEGIIRKFYDIEKSLFSNFWCYLEDELFDATSEYISTLPALDIISFVYDSEINNFYKYDKKYIFHLLSFISERNDVSEKSFKLAVEFILEYIRKDSDIYSMLVDTLKNRQNISFNKFDLFLSIILDREDILCSFLILELADLLLRIYGTDKYSDLRIRIWKRIFSCNTEYPEKVEEIIIEYLKVDEEYKIDVLIDDLKLLISFLENNYTPDNFRINYYFNEFTKRISAYNTSVLEPYAGLLSQYNTEEYNLYTILDENKLYRKDRFYCRKIMDIDYKEYYTVKKKELSQSIAIKIITDYEVVLQALGNSYLIDPNYSNVIWSIRYLLSQILEENRLFGIELIRRTIDTYPKTIRDIISLPMMNMKSENDLKIVWEYVISLPNEALFSSKLMFFSMLTKQQVSIKWAEESIDSFREISESKYNVDIDYLDKFIHIFPNIYEIVLGIICSKYKDENIDIAIRGSRMNLVLDKVKSKDWLVEFYFIQKEIDDKFDYNESLFLALFDSNKDFLIDYLLFYNKKTTLLRPHFNANLSFIWNQNNIEKVISKIIDIYISDSQMSIDEVIEREYCCLKKDLVCDLFSNLNEMQYERALQYLLQLLDDCINNLVVLNLVFSISRRLGKASMKLLLLKYLDYPVNIEVFERIELTSSSITITGSETFGGVEVGRWTKILEIVESYPSQISVRPIINYIKERIAWARKREKEELEKEYVGRR